MAENHTILINDGYKAHPNSRKRYDLNMLYLSWLMARKHTQIRKEIGLKNALSMLMKGLQVHSGK